MPTDRAQVPVIPAAHLRAAGGCDGFRPADDAFRAALLDSAQYSFRPRSEVETDPTFLQLIPYVVLRHGGDLFHYRRGAAGTEARLRARRSVGIGGHINEHDAAGPGDPYCNGMARELTEEVSLGGGPVTEQLLGFLHDDCSPVGRVHLGVVHLIDLAAADARPREDALADAGFAPLADLLKSRDEFETWSQFVMDELARRPPTEASRRPGG